MPPPKPKRPKSLSSSRPPLLRGITHGRISKPGASATPKPSSALLVPSKPAGTATTSRATRTIIRSYHVLQKELAQANARGEMEKAAQLEAQIEAMGGLKAYQKASLTGQKKDRGGDSSGVLISWIEEWVSAATAGQRARKRKRGSDGQEQGNIEGEKEENGLLGKEGGARGKRKTVMNLDVMPKPTFDVLEVGALSPENLISSYVKGGALGKSYNGRPRASITRIDLHSQHASILTQDFMERPLPKSEDEKFDLISLSLVLNYVPDAVGRGEMLKRTCEFLKKPKRRVDLLEQHLEEQQEDVEEAEEFWPCLFLVLPAPCVENSRYLTEDHLTSIMATLGYTMIRRKISAKLVYHLWRWDGSPKSETRSKKGKDATKRITFPKKEINPGPARNNFCVILT